MRFLYVLIATFLWLYLLTNIGATEFVSNDTILLTVSIIWAGGLAGGA